MTETEARNVFKFFLMPGAFRLDEQSVKLMKGWTVVADKESLRPATPPLFWDGTNTEWLQEHDNGYEFEFDTYVIKEGEVFNKALLGSAAGFFAQYYIQSWNGHPRLKEACLHNCMTFADWVMPDLDSEEKILQRRSFAGKTSYE